ncbi:nucleoside deaminase [Rhodohalobacter mucosus]|uniref:tRNA-specific adenosine deaminase n=1 Tax=Rhodohalobacter mucosus TaxID=2079485 RepID=A0A316TR42_9BACT|nr:nucleoside deaminase [Rhodohalobacter mucosus]PWN05729.1 tRNA-specific adenosine deaminase [Rhodohalobacter mucosus]
MLKPYLSHMHAAIEAASAGKTPFGAAIAMGDELFVTAANNTTSLHDPTAHAEVMAIRKMGSQIQKTDLSGFTLYTTCEPCPMCASAVVWSGIGTVYYGCTIPQISTRMDQITLRSDELNRYSFRNVDWIGGVLVQDCLKLLNRYS